MLQKSTDKKILHAKMILYEQQVRKGSHYFPVKKKKEEKSLNAGLYANFEKGGANFRYLIQGCESYENPEFQAKIWGVSGAKLHDSEIFCPDRGCKIICPASGVHSLPPPPPTLLCVWT